ncbi:hypothetical protein Cri9333_1467 [Crinalium epipsammum PCC 9333]|uniref:Uncharacterized protein n=1 Tax=Crinalium epipsammum PCC 9333 TaxID=1173022 RepID=K9VYX2_9CYAN|nr:general stress protein [Crinalium epipsammum]AFZ12360.1 hypothetical protein Cri9333_1467 [Crinalium epipsammum PCC 9333]
MTVSNQQIAIGLFLKRSEAENALNELKASGFPMDKVSVIAQDAEEGEQVGDQQISDKIGDQDVNAASGVVADTLTATTLGSVMLGLASIAVPGVGMIIGAGSVGAAIAATVASTGVAAAASGGLVKAITDLGVPEAQARIYSDRLQGREYLVIVEGTGEDISRAETIVNNYGISNWGIYNSAQA